MTPTDFGHYAAASVITGVGTVFSESGMLSALIRRPDRIDEAASTAFFSLIVSGTLLTLGALAVAPLVGCFFHSGKVTALSAALAGALLVQSLSVVPDAVLQRRFSFARRVAVDPLSSVAFSAVASPGRRGRRRRLGAGRGRLRVAAGIGHRGACRSPRFRPRLALASVAMWRELASFARPVLGSEILSKVATQLDTVMLGRFKGAAALGQYRNGLRVAQQPSDGFVSIGAYVLLPALVRLARSPRAAARGHATDLPADLRRRTAAERHVPPSRHAGRRPAARIEVEARRPRDRGIVRSVGRVGDDLGDEPRSTRRSDVPSC